MFFSYTMSVVLLSLAMYGAWYVIHDMWKWWLEPHFIHIPSCSFLVIVKNLDEEIEDLLRYLAREIEYADIEGDIVVADVSTDDFTATILEKLADDIEILSVAVVPPGLRPIGETIALCRGAVVHVLDLSNRMSTHDFMVTVCALLRQDSHEVMIKKVAK